MFTSTIRSALLAVLILIEFASPAKAEMVGSESIANDPAKEKLCTSQINKKTVPFLIDHNYLISERSRHPDATFIATEGMRPQLVECYLRQGTGKFEPASFSPQQSYWHLIHPEGHNPSSVKAQTESDDQLADEMFRRSYNPSNCIKNSLVLDDHYVRNGEELYQACYAHMITFEHFCSKHLRNDVAPCHRAAERAAEEEMKRRSTGQ